MLKKTITYTDFNGSERSEDFYFNLSKAELVELQVSEKQGFSQMLNDIVKAEDPKEIVAIFKKIILLSYGEKSDDGRRFIKSDELRDNFTQTEAYSNLFVELSTDDEAATAFVRGIVPADFADTDFDALAAGEEEKPVETANVTEGPLSEPVSNVLPHAQVTVVT